MYFKIKKYRSGGKSFSEAESHIIIEFFFMMSEFFNFAINYQLSTINYQLSTINYQPFTAPPLKISFALSSTSFD